MHALSVLFEVAKRGNRAAKQMQRSFAKELKRTYKLAQKRLRESAGARICFTLYIVI